MDPITRPAAKRRVAIADFREVSQPEVDASPRRRKQKLTPSKQRRKERRALEHVARTTSKIQGAARERQGAWAVGAGPNVTETLTVDLDHLYGDLRTGRRDAYARGEAPEGADYRGTTARVTR